MRLLVFLLFFKTLVFAQSDADFGLVKVSSKYFDQTLGHWNQIEGNGVLVEKGDQLFVLTVTHLSHGHGLALEYAGENLTILDDLSDILIDLHLIEVEKPKSYRALAVWDDSNYFHLDSLRFPESHHLASLLPQVGELWGYSKTEYGPNFRGSYDLSQGISYPGSYKLIGPSRLLLLPSWLGELENYQFSTSRGEDLRLQSTTRWYRSQLSGFGEQFALQLQPGTSGAPIFSFQQLDSRQFSISLVGLATQSHIFFPRSNYTDAAGMNLLFSRYSRGMRGESTSISWRMSNGQMAQKEPGVYDEGSASNASSYVPPSPSTYTDIGKGTMIDVGQLSVEELRQFEYGLTYKGRKVLGFEIQTTDWGKRVLEQRKEELSGIPPHQVIPVLANRPAIQLLKSEANQEKSLFVVSKVYTKENIRWPELFGKMRNSQSTADGVFSGTDEVGVSSHLSINEKTLSLSGSQSFQLQIANSVPFITRDKDIIYDVSGLFFLDLGLASPVYWGSGGLNFCRFDSSEAGYLEVCEQSRELSFLSIFNGPSSRPQIRWRAVKENSTGRISF